MTIWRRVTEYLSFTRNEQKILLFLTIVFAGGIAVKAYKAYIVTGAAPKFDYSRSDSIFAERSKRLLNDTGETKKHELRQKINLNTASKNELMALPGIGEGMAERILLFREEKGRFKSITDLKRVKGIGEKKFGKLKQFIEAQ